MKRKILFVMPSFGIGGTTLSTYNLITLLDNRKYEISILPMHAGGPFKQLFDEIGYIEPSYILNAISASKIKPRNCFLDKLTNLLRRICHKLYFLNVLLQIIEANKVSQNKYDIVVACQEGYCTDFARRIKSKKHIAWIRCEFKRFQALINNKNLQHTYDKYDKIVGVSENTVMQFSEIYPSLSERLIAINNPQSEEFIIRQSEKNDQDPTFKKDVLTLVSVGRMDPVKRFAEIPQIARKLLDKGLKFTWYIIGDGDQNELQNIKQNIIEKDVIEYVKMLGAKSNAHFYIKNSDILICLSKSEACPRVINEAKILHVPVICTDFNSAHEFIESGKNGIICTIDEIADNILNLTQNHDLYNKIQDNINGFAFDNSEILDKVYKIF